MTLWIMWWNIMKEFRPACGRFQTFLWLCICCAGFIIREDTLGVSSIIRAFGFNGLYYDRILDFLHSKGLNLQTLTQIWFNFLLKSDLVIKEKGFLLIVGDGFKNPKSGKKMPGVKGLHQESESNTKPSYITGHSFQAIGILAGKMKSIFSREYRFVVIEYHLISNLF